MTSAAQPQPPTASQQQQQQQRPPQNPTYPHQPPVPTHAQSAVSPPNKRDLKSWWKGFKIPTKHQEANGTDTPSTRSISYRSKSLFVEDLGGVYSEDPSSVAVLRQLAAASVETKTHKKASASLSIRTPSRHPQDPTLDTLARILTWRYGRGASPACSKRNSFGAKLIVPETRPLGIFGVPLRQSITYANVAISLIDEDGKSYIYGYVPIVVAKCGVFLKEKATEVEGIFRLSGSEKRIKELKTIFDSPDRYGKGLVWGGYTVHDAANVLRRYLNDLPEPVVPLDLYEKFREPLKGATRQAAGDGSDGPQFVDNFDMDKAIARYQQLITELPPLNRQLLLYILDLLAVFAAKSDQNRMNSQNLAAIFQPGMLSHPHHAMAPEEYRLNQCVIIFLIENQDNFLIGMQGTAADEKTVREVQKGTPAINAPATPVPVRKSGVTRSSSNASAGAESVAKDGQIRRNKSTSSRRSMHSNGAPSPASPALASTPTSGGLARSNTLPSKKSPALQSGRFANRNDNSSGPVTPLTPLAPPPAPAASPPEVVKEAPTPPDEATEPSAAASVAASSLAPGQPVSASRSQERLLDPNVDVGTPSKERRIPSLFQRSPTGESESRQPNKLRKKRLPGDPHTSAHSSTTSLPYSQPQAASPNVEAANPLETIPSRPKNLEATSQVALETITPPEATPKAPQPPSQTLHPNSSGLGLKTKISPPTSLHSSFNEGSDHVESPTGPPPAPAANVPTSDAATEKEKKSRWRLSRKQDPPTSNPNPSSTSPRKVLGTNSNAEGSTSTVGSSSNYKSGHSMTGDSEFALGSGGPGTDEGSKENKDDGKGIAGWLKNKYRERKENLDQRRNKSPPAILGGERGSGFLGRGKSLDLKRTTGQGLDDVKNHPLLSPGLPKENSGQLHQPPPLQQQVNQPAQLAQPLQAQQQVQPQQPSQPQQAEKESEIGQAQ